MTNLPTPITTFNEDYLHFGDDEYLLYQERYGDEDVDNCVYICLWMGEKTGARGFSRAERVKCPMTLNELDERSARLKDHLIANGYLTGKEYDEWFGIFTLVSASW